ncbi:MAG: hypothetical protein ACOCX9_04500 [Spirochaetota bacterium]
MKKIIICLGLMGVVSCSSTSKVMVTGEKYAPLPPGEEVRLVLIDEVDNYNEIGIVEIAGMTLDQRVKKAREVARTYGGDTIMPYGIYDEKTKKKATAGYQVQSFYILKTRIEKEQKETAAKVDDLTDLKLEEDEMDKGPEGEVSTSIASLPRATYKQLLEQYPAMQGKEYYASLFPVKFYKVPSSLKVYDIKNHKLLLMQTGSAKYKLLVFVPENSIDGIKKSIKDKDKIDFAYSPIGVYKQRFPVLKLIKQE